MNDYSEKILYLIQKLEESTDDTIINVFKNSKDLDITKQLFAYFLKTNYSLSLKIYHGVDDKIQEKLQEVFFSFLLENDFNEKVIIGLVILGNEYQEKYLEEHKEIKEDLLSYDDIIYKTLIEKEKYELYLDYVTKCYLYQKGIPKNTERLKLSDMVTNKKAQNIIQELEKKLYLDKRYQKLLFFANNTKTLKNLPTLLNIKPIVLFEKVDKENISYPAKYLAYSLTQKSELEGLYSWFRRLKDNIDIHKLVELILTKYKIILQTNDLASYSLFISKNFLKEVSKHSLSSKEVLNIFYYHAKLFNKYYMYPEEYCNLILKDRNTNPFSNKNEYIGENEQVKDFFKKGEKIIREEGNYIDFLDYGKVRNYLKQENEVLRQEALLLARSEDVKPETLFKTYFNSIIKYVVPLDTFIENFVTEEEEFIIYNTIIEGTILYKDSHYYIQSIYGQLKVVFLDDLSPATICPGLKIEANLSSYSYKENLFYINNIKWKLNEEKKPYFREILSSCLENNIKEEYHSEFANEDFLIYSTLKNFLDYEYIYLKYKEEFTELDNKIKENIYYHLALENEQYLLKLFHKYVLGENKEKLILKIVDYIDNILKTHLDKALTDLTLDDNFNLFRSTFYKIMLYLENIDIEFKNEIISALKNKNLLSITYYDLEDPSLEYYQNINKYPYILNFYKNYPKLISSTSDTSFLNMSIDNDLKFYLALKTLEKNPALYEDLKEKLFLLFSKKTEYKDWIKALYINVYKFPENSLIHIISGGQYEKETLSLEDKEFAEKCQETFNYGNYEVVGNTLKEIINNIRQGVSQNTIEKIKELSKTELTDKEKLELSLPLLKIITLSNMHTDKIYLLLTSLGKNNPFYMSNHFTIKDFKELTKEERSTLIRIKNILDSPLKRINFFCLTPLHIYADFFVNFEKVPKEQLKTVFSNYNIYGTIDIHNNGNDVQLNINNLKIKSENINCDSKYFTTLPFHIIPKYDEIVFEFIEKKDTNTIIIIPKIDFSIEDEILEKAKNDYSYYQNLSIEDKKQLLIHYCRYNVIDAYIFDKEHVLEPDTYIKIMKLLDAYHTTYEDELYFSLLLQNKKLFKEMLYQNRRLEIQQKSLLNLQKRLLEQNSMELYDILIKYLDEEHYLNKRFIYEKALPYLEERESFKKYYKAFDPLDQVKKSLASADINIYFQLKKLDINQLRYCYGDEAYKEYFERNIKYENKDIRESLYMIYISIKEICVRKEISDKVFLYLKNIKANDLIRNNIDYRRRLLITLNSERENINDIFELYRGIINKQIEEGKDYLKDSEKLFLFASFFPDLREKIDNLLLEKENLRQFSIYIKEDNYYLDLIKNSLHKKINELGITKNMSIYDIGLISLLKEVFEIEKKYLPLEFNSEINTLLRVLTKRNILMPQLIFFKNLLNNVNYYYKKTITKMKIEKNKEILNNSVLRKIIIDAFSTYDVRTIIGSNWIKKLFKLGDEIDNLNEYYNKNPYTLIYDNRIILFFKNLYLFENDLVNNQTNKEANINLFIQMLISKKILFPELILNSELNKYYEESKDRQHLDDLSRVKATENNAFSLKMRSINKSNIYLDKSMQDYCLYKFEDQESVKLAFIEMQKDFYQKERFEDAYYITLQYIINYPDSDLTNEMILSLKNENLVIPPVRQEQAQDLYLKASLTLINNKKIDDLYNLTKNAEKVNPYYSTSIPHEFNKMDESFIIEATNYTKEQKIYLYMRSILKFGVNFNSFIYELYKDELINNKMVELNLPYSFLIFVYNGNTAKIPIKLDLDLEPVKNYSGCNVSIELTTATLENDKVKFNYRVLEITKQGSVNLVEEDDELYSLINNNQEIPYERILKAIIQGRVNLSEQIKEIVFENLKEGINKYILFSDITLNNIYTLFYTSKILYEHKRHSLLKHFIYLLIANKSLNDRYLYNGFNQNEYVYTTRMNSSMAISTADVYLLYNLDMTKPLIDELKRILDIIDEEYKLYIYYAICYRSGYFDYPIKLFIDNETESLLVTITYKLLKDKRNPKLFFESLGKNNIFEIADNKEDYYNQIYEKAEFRLIKNYADNDNLEGIKLVLKDKKMEKIEFKNPLYISQEIYSLLDAEEQEKLSNFYKVIIRKQNLINVEKYL